MQKTLLLALLALASCTAAPAQNDAWTEYLKKYHHLAVEEMDENGVPASIKLAQALLESNAGQSTLATQANNHFGVKCSSNWDGKTFYIEDDDRDAGGQIVKSCFRKYKNVEDSYEDHSDFLRDPKKYNRYGFLFKLNPTDYRSWAYGLQSAGYATSETYAESLIRVIETNRLFEYDKMSAAGGRTGGGQPNAPGTLAGARLQRINDAKVVTAKEGETIDEIARIYRLGAEKLLEYNDRGYARSDKLKAGTKVYVQKKGKRWHGRAKKHFVRDGQTMFDISQQYGILLDKLLAGNKMDYGEEPANGTEVRLRGFFWRKGPKPRLRTEEEMKNQPKPGGTGPDVNPRPGQPNPGNPSKNNDKMTTDNEELFEIGNGSVKPDVNRPGQGANPAPGKPSTTGTSWPSDPSPQTDRPGDNTTQPHIPPPVTRPPPTQPAGPGTYHTIIKGDTLYNVSKRYGTTVARIKELNGMTSDYIQIGQSIRVQ